MNFSLVLNAWSIYAWDMSLADMKPFFRVVAALILLGIAALIGLASWRLATRPKAIGLPVKQIRSQITKGMPRSTVLELLGPPHNPGETDHYFYINSYLSREARHHSETPSNFGIFFKEDKVDSILSAYDY
jgi:outer membrane protein assembly factor BamE (lipoprotein component of BamABCDE complex)